MSDSTERRRSRRTQAKRAVPRRRVIVASVLAFAAVACARSQAPAPTVNLALGRAPSVTGGRGEPASVTDGRLEPEGAPPGAAAVKLGGVLSSLIVDLGSVRSLRALLLQAGSADIYFVEAATDGSNWRVVWRVAPVPGGNGLRTRTIALRRAVACRWLRVRPTTPSSPAVAEIQVFEAEPRPWPALDESRRDSRLPLWPGLTSEKAAALISALAALFMLVVAWNVWGLSFPQSGRGRRWRRGALLVVAALSLVAWPNFLNFHYYGFVHTWEVFHYYLGGKYLPELGYTRLYLCAATAAAEDGIDPRGTPIRDLRDSRLVPAEAELERSGECRARFSPRRWEAFRRDARFFRDAMGPLAWTGVQTDHGFNATPAWALVGGFLAALAPASWPQIAALTLLDMALVLAMIAVIGWSFGLEAACVAAGYWGLNALAPFGWTGGGFLRYDWLLALVIGIAALRSGRSALAGFALTCSALLRVFPVFALLGLGLKVAADAVRERSLRPLRAQARLAAGAAAAVLLLVGGSTLATRHVGIWPEFVANSAKHVRSDSTNRVGLPIALSYRDDTRQQLMVDPLLLDRNAAWLAQTAAGRRDVRPVQAVVIAAYLLLLLACQLTRQPPAWVAAVLGLGLVPMILPLSCYYYSMLVVLAMLWPVSPAIAVALACFAWLTNVIMALWSSPDSQYARLSLAVVVLVAGIAGALAWPRRPRTPDRAE